jgi:hypothetical protein
MGALANFCPGYLNSADRFLILLEGKGFPLLFLFLFRHLTNGDGPITSKTFSFATNMSLTHSSFQDGYDQEAARVTFHTCLHTSMTRVLELKKWVSIYKRDTTVSFAGMDAVKVCMLLITLLMFWFVYRASSRYVIKEDAFTTVGSCMNDRRSLWAWDFSLSLSLFVSRLPI